MRLSVRVLPGVWVSTGGRRRGSSSAQRARGTHFAPKEAQDEQARKLAAKVYPKLATKLAGRSLYWLFIFACSLVIVATCEPVVWTVLGSVVAFLCLRAVIADHQAKLESIGRQVMANRAAQQQALATARQVAIESTSTSTTRCYKPGSRGWPSLAARTAARLTTRPGDHAPTVRGSANQLATLAPKRCSVATGASPWEGGQVTDDASQDERLRRSSARVDPVMMVLALLWLPVLVVPLVRRRGEKGS